MAHQSGWPSSDCRWRTLLASFQPMKFAWEYKTLHLATQGWLTPKLDQVKFEALLNELGRDGWELVGTFATHEGYGRTSAVMAVLKRPR